MNSAIQTEALIDIVHTFFPSDKNTTQFNSCLMTMACRDVAALYVTLAWFGELEALEAAYASCGAVPLAFLTTGIRQTLNGKFLSLKVRGKAPLDGIKTPADMLKLLERLPELGLGFLVGVDSPHSILFDALTSAEGNPRLLLHELSKPTDRHRLLRPGFAGHLPTLDLDNMTLTDPELMLALQQRAEQSRYPDAYKQILCWVPEPAVRDNQDQWRAYQSQQDILFSKNTVTGEWGVQRLSMASLDAAALERLTASDDYRYQGFTLKASRDATFADPIDEYLLQELGSTEINYGFSFKPGYVLCRMTLDELDRFSVVGQDEQQMTQALAFVREYAPTWVMASLYSTDSDKTYKMMPEPLGIVADSTKPDLLTLGVANLLDHVGREDDIGRAVVSCIQPHILEHLITRQPPIIKGHFPEPMLNWQGVRVAINNLGIDISQIVASLNEYDTEHFLSSDITLTSDTHTYFHSIGLDKGTLPSTHRLTFWIDYHKTKKVMDKLFAKGARIINGHDFSDLKKSIVGARKGHNMPFYPVHISRIRFGGLDSCLKLARTTVHWEALEEAFGREAIVPHISKAPAHFRGDKFSEDLGL